jgi:hypothetical protein
MRLLRDQANRPTERPSLRSVQIVPLLRGAERGGLVFLRIVVSTSFELTEVAEGTVLHSYFSARDSAFSAATEV